MRPDPHKKKYTGSKKKEGRKNTDQNKNLKKGDKQVRPTEKCPPDLSGSESGASANVWKTGPAEKRTDTAVIDIHAYFL